MLSRDEELARSALVDALAQDPKSWQRETTADNLKLIHEARAARGEALDWAAEIESELRLLD